MTLVRAEIDSPLGVLALEASDAGLRALRYDPARWPAVGAMPESPAATVPVVDHPVLAAAAREVDEYFAGTRRTFDLPLDLTGSRFRREVLSAMTAIPYGQVWSYLDLARRLGRDANSARAVGRACNGNPLPIVVPCHRVVAADGSLGGYAAGLDVKRWLLALERGDPAVPPGGWEPARARALERREAPRLFDPT